MRRPFLYVCLVSLVGSFGLAAQSCGNDGDGRATVRDDNEQRVHGLTKRQARETLAKIGDTTITVGDFADELASKGSFIRTRYSSPERRREFLDQMIRFELLAQEAERRGYDDVPEVQRTRKQMMIRQFLEERFEQGTPETIPADDVREYYESHRTEFNTPEQVRVSHILFRDRRTAERVLEQLSESPDDLRLYRQLAEQHNTDTETRDRFGDLRFFSRPSERTQNEPEVPAAVAEAAFTIQRIGAFYPEVVESDRGFHVVKLTGRRAAMHRSLEEAERPIRNRLWRERRENAIQELIDRLRRESDVEENLDLLSEVHLDIPTGEFPTTEHQQQGGPVGPTGVPALTQPTKRPATRSQ